jgi:hypothetical protein
MEPDYKALHKIYSDHLRKWGLYDPKDYRRKASGITKKFTELSELAPENCITPARLSEVLASAEREQFYAKVGYSFHVIANAWLTLLRKPARVSPRAESSVDKFLAMDGGAA